MHKIGSKTGLFENGTRRVPGTPVTADWLNAVQTELINIIQEAGIAPDKEDQRQLLDAVKKIVGNTIQGLAGLSSPSFSGVPETPEPDGENKNQIANVAYVEKLLSEALLKFATENPGSIEELQKLLAKSDKTDAIALLQSLINQLMAQVSGIGVHNVDMWLAQAVTDVNGQVAYGVTHGGDFYQPSATIQNNDNFPGWAMVDRRNHLLFGFHAPNGEMMLPGGHIGLHEDTAYVVTDQDGRAATHIKPDGSVHFSGGVADDSGMVYLKDGDVFRQKGGVTTRITQRGDVVACQAYGQAVRYVAPRRGVMLTYEVAGGKTKQVFEESSTDGYIVTGQSLAEGGANQAVTKTPVAVGRAYMMDTGPVPNQSRSAGSRPVDLKEQVYETICSSFATCDLKSHDRRLMMLGAAHGGMVYSRLKKGGNTGVYEKIIKQLKTMMNFPFKPTYKALFVIHGEGDGNISNTAYDKNLIEWLNDFTADIKAITGQEEQPVMLTCQTSSAAGYKGTAEGRHQFTTPFLQLKASEEHPRIFLVCPKYQFNYKDYAHILAPDTKYLGEYYAKVKKIVVDEGGDWLGLRPKTLTKVDARTVDIEFHVPVAPLVLDEEQVVNPGNYGFALYNSGTASIHSVKLLANQNKIRITSTEDIPSGAKITYAFDNGVGGKSGRAEGSRGNLRDSDTAVSLDGQFKLYNWAFAFELPVNQE